MTFVPMKFTTWKNAGSTSPTMNLTSWPSRGSTCSASHAPIAATTGSAPGDAKDRILGDGLVPLASALGRHARPEKTLPIRAENQWIGYETGHLDLLSKRQVYDQIRRWLAT